MTISEALKNENLRVSNGDRWLVIDKERYEVYGYIYYKSRSKKPIILIETTDEAKAVAVLLGEEVK